MVVAAAAFDFVIVIVIVVVTHATFTPAAPISVRRVFLSSDDEQTDRVDKEENLATTRYGKHNVNNGVPNPRWRRQ